MDIRGEIKRDLEQLKSNYNTWTLCSAFSIYGNLRTFRFVSFGVGGSIKISQVSSLQKENLERMSWRVKRGPRVQ